eukprot:scaffold1397_cov254-Pinguiococcus_pyrenoidosus.AAC.53
MPLLPASKFVQQGPLRPRLPRSDEDHGTRVVVDRLLGCLRICCIGRANDLPPLVDAAVHVGQQDLPELQKPRGPVAMGAAQVPVLIRFATGLAALLNDHIRHERNQPVRDFMVVRHRRLLGPEELIELRLGSDVQRSPAVVIAPVFGGVKDPCLSKATTREKGAGTVMSFTAVV